MARPRISLMIMREGETDSAVRSYSLPGYLPRLALIAGVVFVLLATVAGVSIVYFWQAAEDAETLRAENASMRRAAARVGELEAELEQHRQFTRRVARMIGIDLPAFSDSVPSFDTAEYASSNAGMNGRMDLEIDAESRNTPEQAPLEAISPGAGVLVTECRPDPNNRQRGMPVRGRVSRGFLPSATNPGLRHRGIDIATREGSPIYAPASGIVVYAGQDDVLGLMLTIDHGGGFKTIYGHNSRLHVRIGDKVFRGDVIGLTGNTGESTAPHLHYEVRRDDQSVDPMGFLGK
jgi:murein DD-endopeptidase MepM/ murein hydrolase activator NlpD